jgi:hypothetical protein
LLLAISVVPALLTVSCSAAGPDAGDEEDVDAVEEAIITCGEASCVPVGGAHISHFTGTGCTGTESYYTPYFSDSTRRSWNGAGLAGTTLRTVTNRSWKDTKGVCHDAWPQGNTLSQFVTIYRSEDAPAGACAPYDCPEGYCRIVSGTYISHYEGLGCTGKEYYYTPYFLNDGVRRSWNGKGTTGLTLRTVTVRSYRDATGVCRDAWKAGNTLSKFVRIYRDPPKYCIENIPDPEA